MPLATIHWLTMRGLTKEYVLQRFLMYLLTIWLGTTLIFVIPRLAPGDPVSEMVIRLSLDYSKSDHRYQQHQRL